jgi:uncharacterized protein
MRLGGGNDKDFIDRTGQSGGSFGLGGGGGNALGCLIPLIMSRFGIGGVVVLVIGYFILSSLGGLGGGGGVLPTGGAPESSSPGQSRLSPETSSFLQAVLSSTDTVWTDIFRRNGATYQEPQMVAYTSGTSSGCGAAQSAMGPFYCPTDGRIYLDPQFFNELSTRFQAPGDFAMAYVIAHEVGHHVQDLEGTLNRASSAQARASRAEGNAIQVEVELQADCYAGVWAARARAPDGKPAMEQGDFEEGMRAAEAIGDDTLQRQTQGAIVPESFTHGTSAQRMAALRTGFQSGDPAACKI